MPLVGEHQHAERSTARSQRDQEQVAIAKGLGQQLTSLDVVQAVGDDGRLLGDKDPTDQGRCIGAEAQLVESHLVEEPALPHPRGGGRRDQRLEPILVEEEATHLDVEQLGELGGQGAEVLAELGQVGDRRGDLEKVAQFLEILVGPAGKLEVLLDQLEVFEGPEAGEHHDRQEEHRQEVGDGRGRPPARHVDEEELRQGAKDYPEPPIEPDPGGGCGMPPRG